MGRRTVTLALVLLVALVVCHARPLPVLPRVLDLGDPSRQNESPEVGPHVGRFNAEGQFGYNKVALTYDSQRSQKRVHQLDDLHPLLAEWECSPGTLLLQWRNTDSSLGNNDLIDFQIGDIVTGTSTWTCGQPLGEQLILVVEAVSNSPRGHVTRLTTAPGKLSDLFEHLDLSLTSPDGLHLSEMPSSDDSSIGGEYTTDELAELKEFEEIVTAAKPPMLLVLAPHTSSAYSIGDTVTVSWRSNYSASTGPLLVQLVLDTPNIADRRAYAQANSTALSEGTVSFTVTGAMPSSRWYFVMILANCQRKCEAFVSGYIKINEMPKIYVTSPIESDVYLPGDSIVAEWALDPNFAKTGTRGTVSINTLGPDGKWTTIASQTNVVLSSGKTTFTLPQKLVAGSWYYVIVSWNCTKWNDVTKCESETSPYFTVRTSAPKRPDLVFLSPEQGATYQAGQTLEVRWAGTVSGTIDLFFKRQRPFGNVLVRKVTLSGTEQSHKIFIDPSLLPDSNYYVRIEYDCRLGVLGFRAFCHVIETPRFSINVKPVFQFTNPSLPDASYTSLPAQLTASWKPLQQVSGPITLSLMQSIPMWFDRPLNSLRFQVNASGSQAVTLDNGSPFPLYWRLSYNCKFFGFGCQHAYSPRFNVISQTKLGWNYDEVRNRAKETIQLLDLNCAQCPGNLPPAFCKGCNVVKDGRVSVTCPQCYTHTAIKLYRLQFALSGMNILTMSYDLRGSVFTNADLHLDMSGSLSYSGNKHLWTAPAMGAAVNVAGLKLSFGILIDLKAPYLFAADGALSADAGFDAVLDFSSSLLRGTMHPNPIFNYSAGVSALNIHSPVINANANLRAQAGLEARLRATFVTESILSASASASGNLDLTASFRNPPFPPKAAPANSTCTKPHRTEWGLDFFVVGSGQANLAQWNKESPAKEYFRKTLATGCLLPVN